MLDLTFSIQQEDESAAAREYLVSGVGNSCLAVAHSPNYVCSIYTSVSCPPADIEMRP